MSTCKFCKKKITWLEVPVETPAGTTLKARAFNPRARRGEPLRPHECHADVKGRTVQEIIVDEHVEREDKKPWWLRD